MIIVDENKFVATYCDYQQNCVKEYAIASKLKGKLAPCEIENKYVISRGRLNHWFNAQKTPRPLRAINCLKQKNLLPLKIEETEKFKTILRLFSWMYGDGTLGKADCYISLTGQKDDLSFFAKEIENNLGFGTKITFVQTKGNGIAYHLEIQGDGNRMLGRLLHAMGAPIGDRVKQVFYLPEWLISSPKWVKKEFLEILFANELQTPSLDKNKVSAVKSMNLRLSKDKRFMENHKQFLSQIKELISEFGLDTSDISIDKGEFLRKDGIISKSAGFPILTNHINFLKFANTFNLKYCRAKQESIERVKKKVIEELSKEIQITKLYDKAMEMKKQGHNLVKTSRTLKLDYGRIKSWFGGSKPIHYKNLKECEELCLKT